jgi:hypothetical protein
MNKDLVAACKVLFLKGLSHEIPATRLDLRENLFIVRVCDKWNSLPSEIKNSENVKSFNTSYRRHMGTCPPQAMKEPACDDL